MLSVISFYFTPKSILVCFKRRVVGSIVIFGQQLAKVAVANWKECRDNLNTWDTVGNILPRSKTSWKRIENYSTHLMNI